MSIRETWVVTNISNVTFSIGDLPAVPSFGPNDHNDLLLYYTKAQIEQSQDLITIMGKGWIGLVKTLDNTPETLTTDNIVAGLTTPDELTGGGGGGGNINMGNYDLSFGSDNYAGIFIYDEALYFASAAGFAFANNEAPTAAAFVDFVGTPVAMNIGAGTGGSTLTLDGANIYGSALASGHSGGTWYLGDGTGANGEILNLEQGELLFGTGGGAQDDNAEGFYLWDNNTGYIQFNSQSVGFQINGIDLVLNHNPIRATIAGSGAKIVTDTNGGWNIVDSGNYILNWNQDNGHGLNLGSADIYLASGGIYDPDYGYVYQNGGNLSASSGSFSALGCSGAAYLTGGIYLENAYIRLDNTATINSDGSGNVTLTTTSIAISNANVPSIIFSPQSTAPSSPTTGEAYYDNAQKQLLIWNGAAWENQIASQVLQIVSVSADATATGSTTLYTVPTGQIAIIENFSVLTLENPSPATAPYIEFGVTGTPAAFVGATQLPVQTQYARYRIDNPTGAIVAGTAITGTVSTASTATGGHTIAYIITFYLLTAPE